MAKTRARTSTGSFIADDPSTPENEAYVNDTPKPKGKWKPKFANFISTGEESGVFDLQCGDQKFMGMWDENREHVKWRFPIEHKENMMSHHHVWAGRIVASEDN